MKNILRLVRVYNILIRPGSAGIWPKNSTIMWDMPLYLSPDISRDLTKETSRMYSTQPEMYQVSD